MEGPECRFRREARARERHRYCSGGQSESACPQPVREATLLGRTDTRQTRPISGTFVQVAGSHMTVIQAPKREPRIMRYELTDFEWAAIKPMLPNKPRGVPRG